MTTMQDVQVETVEAQAQAVAEVMEKHWVFGREGTDYAFYEKHDFVRMVVTHSQEVRPGSLEVTYRNSNVRVIINTQVTDGVASIRDITAYAHPAENPAIDFEEMNEDMQGII